MPRLEKQGDKWVEKGTKPHHGRGRRRSWKMGGGKGTRPCMEKRTRPKQGQRKKEGGSK